MAEAGEGTNNLANAPPGTNPPSALDSLSGALRAVMNSPDQDTLIRAVEDARRILGEYVEPRRRDATLTVEHLLAVLDTNDVVHALTEKSGAGRYDWLRENQSNLQPSRFVEKTNREVETFRLSRV